MMKLIHTIRSVFIDHFRCARLDVPWLAIFAVAMLALAGCEGDTGPQGAQGEPGPAGPEGPAGSSGTTLPDVSEAVELNAAISGVTIASPPVMTFTLTNGRGVGVTGLELGNISFTIARLEDGTNGDASFWQSYVNRTETAGSAGPGTEDKVQATTESANAGNQGTLVDNGDGTYEYTFGTDVANVTDPIPVAYDATLTHRVGFEIRGLAEVQSPSYTWRPSDGATTGLFSRQMINDDSCNACHQNLALHGGARFTNDYCVTCHNPGSEDANSGNTVDMTQMIHKIHRGSSLPTIAGATADARYSIFGFRNSEHIYADNTAGEITGVVFPQDIRNCRNCHDEGDTSTPDAGNWISKPTIEACGACHDDVNFATGENHFSDEIPPIAPPVTNAECVNCHGEGEFAAADEVHRLLEQEEALKFEYKIISVANTGVGETPVATIQVVNPLNDPPTPYNIKTDPPFVQGGSSRLFVNFSWNTVDYTNLGSGSGDLPAAGRCCGPDFPLAPAGSQAQPVSVDAIADSVDNMDGTFNVTSTKMVPATDVVGSLSVAIEGHPGVDVTGDGEAEEIPVTSAIAYFAIDDPNPVERRTVVGIDTCNNCHQSLSLHGSNRTDNIDVCVTCHNPDATDIRARIEWESAPGNGGMTPPDGKKEEVVDMKHMIHAIHAGAVQINGFAASIHDYTHVVFPAEKNTCTNCHDGNTFYPVNQSFVLATTIDTGADLNDPTDDVNISPNASACWGCHQADSVTPGSSPDSAKSHMILNGASFNAQQALDGTLTDLDTNGTVLESCEICHGPGRSSDVATAHGVE